MGLEPHELRREISNEVNRLNMKTDQVYLEVSLTPDDEELDAETLDGIEQLIDHAMHAMRLAMCDQINRSDDCAKELNRVNRLWKKISEFEFFDLPEVEQTRDISLDESLKKARERIERETRKEA
jgi:hypothetical protein